MPTCPLNAGRELPLNEKPPVTEGLCPALLGLEPAATCCREGAAETAVSEAATRTAMATKGFMATLVSSTTCNSVIGAVYLRVYILLLRL